MRHPPGRRVRPSVVVRTALAFGVVLGIGAAATDASWTDEEYAAASFVAGTFVLESSADGTSWADHPSTNAATLSFNATAMYPGQTLAAPFEVRAARGSLGGTVSLSLSSATSSSTTLLAGLAYKVFADTASGCTASSQPSAAGVWIAGNATTLVSDIRTALPANSRALPAATASAAGAPVYYCFIVQLASTVDNSTQGVNATANWVVNGTTS